LAERRAGLLLLDKPAGPTSFAAIASMRPALGRKLGHAGTLDPFATGLLLVLAARATRLAPYLAGVPKSYRATVQLGVRSTTDDPEGELEPSGRRVERAAVEAALDAFRGPIVQVPPAASAVHVGGERAYARFRRGEAVTVPPREVVIHRLVLEAFEEEAQVATLALDCSTGTYVRALARDLGEALGVGAHCASLRRTAIGTFAVADAAAPDAARADPYAAPSWREPLDAVPHLPLRDVDADEAAALRHGRSIAAHGESGAVRCAADGRLLAIARADGSELRPSVVFEPG
jgi:tRNA pseudouridine55 synthase